MRHTSLLICIVDMLPPSIFATLEVRAIDIAHHTLAPPLNSPGSPGTYNRNSTSTVGLRRAHSLPPSSGSQARVRVSGCQGLTRVQRRSLCGVHRIARSIPQILEQLVPCETIPIAALVAVRQLWAIHRVCFSPNATCRFKFGLRKLGAATHMRHMGS
ncbi:hypothetical protein F4808DRAFT_186604 [Astrocystis sublimbata]|nr:hypothetical protein F4808DRAFT_186604 [Astrocystis sublimbata]